MHTARAAPEAADKEWIPRILDFSIDAPRFYSPHTARGSSSLAGIRRFQASPRLQSLTAGPLGLGHRAWAWSSDWPAATVDRALLDRSDRSRPGRSQRRLHPVASEGSHGRTPRGAGSDGAARVLEAPQPGLDGILPGRPVPGTVRYLARPGAPAHPPRDRHLQPRGRHRGPAVDAALLRPIELHRPRGAGGRGAAGERLHGEPDAVGRGGDPDPGLQRVRQRSPR